MAARRKVFYFTDSEAEQISRAAYWEGFNGPSDFIWSVMRKHMARRVEDRGDGYGAIPKAEAAAQVSTEEQQKTTVD